MISAYADLHKIDESGENGVMKIIKLKLKDLYKKLSYYHIEYCPLTSNGETMLHYAARYGDNEMIQKTLSSHLKIKDRTSTQETILHILAARDNKEEFIKKAIQEGININAVDVIGNTALHYACENAQYKNTELLLKNGANPLAVNFNQEKPSDKLKHTTSNNYQSIAKTATLLSETVNNAYQQILEGKIPHPKLIASQKPLFDLSNKSNQHTPE